MSAERDQIYQNVLKLFPGICPIILEKLCAIYNDEQVIITQILDGNMDFDSSTSSTENDVFNMGAYGVLPDDLQNSYSNLNLNHSSNNDSNSDYEDRKRFYRILEVFPGIDHKYVREMCKNIKDEHKIISNLLDGNISLIDNDSNNVNYIDDTDLNDEEKVLFYNILKMFPGVCPIFLSELCRQTKDEDNIISQILNESHIDDKVQMLLDLFPHVDPSYIQSNCEQLMDKENPDELRDLVADMLKEKNLPSKADYLKRKKLQAQEKQYTMNFNVKNFSEIFPNPVQHFENSNRKSAGENLGPEDKEYVLTVLKNRYDQISSDTIIQNLGNNNYNIIKTSQALDRLPNNEAKRKQLPLTSCSNIPVLQELAYIQYKDLILEYMEEKEILREVAKHEAMINDLLLTCQCCFDEEIMPEDTVCCEKDHVFCKECVQRGCETAIGDDKVNFPCLTQCDSQFSLQVIRIVLSPQAFSNLVRKIQVAEVKAADIKDLEFCPFCDFATIPTADDKIFRCMNDECMKESCRLCHEPSHVPLRCNEVEKDEHVKARTYVENKMTEALIRQCPKCGKKFIKETFCNKMTCHCGAMMCYICKQPVTGYDHFNGPGGDQTSKCLLFNDTAQLHRDNVIQSGQQAKRDLGDPSHLRIDPTQGF